MGRWSGSSVTLRNNKIPELLPKSKERHRKSSRKSESSRKSKSKSDSESSRKQGNSPGTKPVKSPSIHKESQGKVTLSGQPERPQSEGHKCSNRPKPGKVRRPSQGKLNPYADLWIPSGYAGAVPRGRARKRRGALADSGADEHFIGSDDVALAENTHAIEPVAVGTGSGTTTVAEAGDLPGSAGLVRGTFFLKHVTRERCR